MALSVSLMSILYQSHEVLAQESTSETTVAPMNEALETTVQNVQIQGQPVPKLIKIDAEGNLIPKNAPVTKPVEEKTKLKTTDPPVIYNVKVEGTIDESKWGVQVFGAIDIKVDLVCLKSCLVKLLMILTRQFLKH